MKAIPKKSQKRKTNRGRCLKCPACGNGFANITEVSSAILSANRDARFTCSSCSFVSLIIVTYKAIRRRGRFVPFRLYPAPPEGEMSRKLGLLCLFCRRPALTRSSDEVAPALKRVYLVCSSPECGLGSIAMVEHFEQLSYSDLGMRTGIPLSNELAQNIKEDTPNLAFRTFQDGL